MNKRISNIIVILVFVIFGFATVKDYKESNKYFNDSLEYREMVENECSKQDSEYPKDYCDSLDDKVDYYDYFIERENESFGTTSIYFIYIIFPFLIPLLVLRSLFRRKTLEYYLIRKNYKSFIKDMLKEAYKVVWVVPFMFLVLYFLGLIRVLPLQNVSIISFLKPLMGVFWHLLLSSILINIALICMRKFHGFLLYIIGSGFVYTVLAFGLELIKTKLWKKGLDLFIFLSNQTFEKLKLIDILGMGIICLTTWIILYLFYRNEEKLVIDCEKDN